MTNAPRLGGRLDRSLALETEQGVPHRKPAHPEALRQLLLAEGLPGGISPRRISSRRVSAIRSGVVG